MTEKSLMRLFDKEWDAVPYVFVDTETTGTIPGLDATVQVALVRFEGGTHIASASSLINPGREIPITAISIHGIADAMVKDAPSLAEFFAQQTTLDVIAGAQPGAYNQTFDRAFVPLRAWGEDWGWPWVDPLTWVRAVDRYAKGAGRHKLEAACERRGIELSKAHDAAADAEAAGRLFFRVVREKLGAGQVATVGEMLVEQRQLEAHQWGDFFSWLARQPAREATP